ncbi:MAG: hypothetical protein R6X23_09125 [Acidimicrobiia bacterium]
MESPPVITTVAALRAHAPDLAGAWVVGLDLRGLGVDWRACGLTGAGFAACTFDGDDEATVVARGATVLPPFAGPDAGPDAGPGFDPYRVALYTNDELMAGYVDGRPETTFDARVGARTVDRPSTVDLVARGIHDACIEAALLRFVDDVAAPVVGLMGSHSAPRTDPAYTATAELARDLTLAGFVIATGGGPGLMEAANLGAWMARRSPDDLLTAIALLSPAPDYAADPPAFLDAALAVRSRFPDGATSLGVPTWVYVHEPPNQFATHVAKYFENSIRENGLLAVARGGVVFTPGGSGTAQEIFTDAAQNDYTLYDVRSPMIFLGSDHYERERPGLLSVVRDLAARNGWEHLVRSVDSREAVVDALHELAPMPPAGAIPPHRRR